MTFPDPEDLPNALITHAMGLTAASAAAELICAHASWLTNTDFTASYITTGTHASGLPYAYIHWDEAIAALDDHQIGGSSPARRLLRIAARLPDHHIPLHPPRCLGNPHHATTRLLPTPLTPAHR